jgi:ribosomal protein L18
VAGVRCSVQAVDVSAWSALPTSRRRKIHGKHSAMIRSIMKPSPTRGRLVVSESDSTIEAQGRGV